MRVQFHIELQPRVTYRAHFLRQKDCEMQIRSKAYRHFLSICRSLRELTSPSDVPTPTSLSLAYTAAVLGLLLVILEIDLHQALLQSIGLMSDSDQIDPIFLSP
jgi:hypothetical protein